MMKRYGEFACGRLGAACCVWAIPRTDNGDRVIHGGDELDR